MRYQDYKDFKVGDIVGYYDNEDQNQNILFLERITKISYDYIYTTILKCTTDREYGWAYIDTTQRYVIQYEPPIRLLTNLEKVKYL